MIQRPVLRSRPLAGLTKCCLNEPALFHKNISLRSSVLRTCSVARYNSTSSSSPSRPFYKSPLIGIPILLLLGYFGYDYMVTPKSTLPINPYTFTHYKITSTTPLSSTSAVLTLSPKNPVQTPAHFWPTIKDAGLWSVQIKQPQLQIQREYTPIPTENSINENENEMRLFVRAVSNGEVSNYLLSRKAGDVVELRGPVITYSWDSPDESLSGSEKVGNVLFVAGGTGVSPALQVAEHLAKQDDGKQRLLTILYASRSSSEIILPDVKALEKVQRPNLKVEVKYFYDDKSTFITKSDIETAMSVFDYSGEKDAGRGLMMVSGPEGFINHFSGKKVWQDGMETQGQLGGIIGEILKKRKQGGAIEVMKL